MSWKVDFSYCKSIHYIYLLVLWIKEYPNSLSKVFWAMSPQRLFRKLLILLPVFLNFHLHCNLAFCFLVIAAVVDRLDMCCTMLSLANHISPLQSKIFFHTHMTAGFPIHISWLLLKIFWLTIYKTQLCQLFLILSIRIFYIAIADVLIKFEFLNNI